MQHLKTQFLKIYTSYFGNKISNPEQIKELKISGSELKAFCEFYLQHFRTAEEIRYSKDDRRVSRILWFTLGFILAIILSLATVQHDFLNY